MNIIEQFTNNKNRVEFWIVEKFNKPNQYGDIERLRAKFYSLEDAQTVKNLLTAKLEEQAKNYINQIRFEMGFDTY